MPSTASTLKFEKVDPPISGSLMSAPSMANVASTPRCPLIANCCSEIGRTVGVGHGAGSQQQQRAEVALIQRQFAHRLARQLFSAGRGLFFFGQDSDADFATARKSNCHRRTRTRNLDRLRVFGPAPVRLNRQTVGSGGQSSQAKAAIRSGHGLGLDPLRGQRHLRTGNGGARGVSQNAFPHCLRLLCKGRTAGYQQRQSHAQNSQNCAQPQKAYLIRMRTYSFHGKETLASITRYGRRQSTCLITTFVVIAKLYLRARC